MGEATGPRIGSRSFALIAPGRKINENQLAVRFGTSRGPIREALRTLEGAGLVETIPNRGAFVRSMSVDEVREIYEVRAALFALAGRLVAERAVPETVGVLDGYIQRMEQGPELSEVIYGAMLGAACAAI